MSVCGKPSPPYFLLKWPYLRRMYRIYTAKNTDLANPYHKVSCQPTAWPARGTPQEVQQCTHAWGWWGGGGRRRMSTCLHTHTRTHAHRRTHMHTHTRTNSFLALCFLHSPPVYPWPSSGPWTGSPARGSVRARARACVCVCLCARVYASSLANPPSSSCSLPSTSAACMKGLTRPPHLCHVGLDGLSPPRDLLA